jgi:DNA-binding beta-propeller fold protein YncE
LISIQDNVTLKDTSEAQGDFPRVVPWQIVIRLTGKEIYSFHDNTNKYQQCKYTVRHNNFFLFSRIDDVTKTVELSMLENILPCEHFFTESFHSSSYKDFQNTAADNE